MVARLGGLIALAGCWTGTVPHGPEVYTFRRLNPGAGVTSAFRQTFELTLDGGRATLQITTAHAAAGFTNADIDRASFARGESGPTLHGAVTTDPHGAIAIDFGHVMWICQRITTHVAAAGAHLVRTGACETEATVQPSELAPIDALSCREAGDDGPHIRTADRDPERRRDSNRWTFTAAPGLELLFDVCMERSGVLRRLVE